MTELFWLEQSEADLPANDEWLAGKENAFLSRLRFAKRRADWRLGRWTAKRAVAAWLRVPETAAELAKIEIRPALSGAPEVFVGDEPAALTISLSHRSGTALCAVAAATGTLGCDLEAIEPRDEAFFYDYFTPEERTQVTQAPLAQRWTMLALLWSAKESALKALHAGLRLDTRSVIVSATNQASRKGRDENGLPARISFAPQKAHGADWWHPVQVRCVSGPIFCGWWRSTGNLLRTMVALPPPASPIALCLPGWQQPVQK